MKKTCLIIFAVLFVVAVQVADGASWCDADIVPEHPTSCDVVVITLSGEWGDSCVPNASAISVMGNDIYFDAIWDYPPDIMCAAVITPWELTRSVGPLAPGTYTVYARIVGYPGAPGYEPVTGFIVVAGSCEPAVYYVDAADGNDLNDGLTPETAFATIQKGVDTTYSGDTVIVAPGIYTGEGNRDIDFYCKAIVVQSVEPADPDIAACTIVDCSGADYGFIFHSGEGPNSVLAGFTITNGHAGIYCSDYSCPTISHCIITNNCADSFSVGILCNNSSPTITNCTISENSAPYGRGISAYGSNLLIVNCLITGNVGADHGGGIYCDGGGNLTITGGAISGNSATYRGGGINVYSLDAVTITNCIICDNTAGSYCGGGFFSYGSSIVIANCTFSGNSAPNGNALAFDSWSSPHPSSVQLKSCILKDGGNEIWNNDGSTIAITYSDVQDGWPGTGNIDAAPCFADPCNDDYHLKSQDGRWDPNSESWVQDDVTSPAIDAGDPNSDWSQEPYPNGGRINMGAYGGTARASMGACFPYCHPDYDEWIARGELLGMPAGRGPECWCYPRQCHGDADGDWDGTAPIGRTYVGPTDLAMFASAWKVLEPIKGPGIAAIPDGVCCDFAHDKTGTPMNGYTYVGPTDLAAFATYWYIQEPPHGPGIPPDCLDCP